MKPCGASCNSFGRITVSQCYMIIFVTSNVICKKISNVALDIHGVIAINIYNTITVLTVLYLFFFLDKILKKPYWKLQQQFIMCNNVS